jgi:hypothetical protein
VTNEVDEAMRERKEVTSVTAADYSIRTMSDGGDV